MTNDDLAFANLATLGTLLRERRVSSVELTALALARLERYGPSYNAVVTILHERAMTWGAEPYRHQTFDCDAMVVRRLEAADAARLPALCVPNGFGEHGLPTGFTFLGAAFDEAKLVAIGTEYQARTTFALARPNVGAHA